MMSVKVWKEVVKIQRKFLWSGLSNRSKISWVKWSNVCKPKSDGGLGVRDLRLTNISLLAKWRWKLLHPNPELWKDIVIAKYGVHVAGTGQLGEDHIPRLSSSWWRNICLLGNNGGWFESGISKMLGNGINTNFWTDTWLGETSLANQFPRLFSISLQQCNTVNQMGIFEGADWRWVLNWRRNFFSWEVPLYHDFLAAITFFQPRDCDDSWQWRADPAVGFTAKSAYYSLIKCQPPGTQLSDLQKLVFTGIWKSASPSKVSAFSWQLLLNRIPTKDNLALRGVDTGNGLLCVACNCTLETSLHLFLHCGIAAQVWYAIARWISHDLPLPPSIFHSFVMLVGCGINKSRKKGLRLIWHAFIWTIWRARNNRIFNSCVIDLLEILDNIKRISWQWFIGRMAKSPCLFYEWCWDSGDCFHR
jgi:hypothetical protein